MLKLLKFFNNKVSFVLLTIFFVHFNTWYDNKSLIYWALGKAVCFVIVRSMMSRDHKTYCFPQARWKIIK